MDNYESEMPEYDMDLSVGNNKIAGNEEKTVIFNGQKINIETGVPEESDKDWIAVYVLNLLFGCFGAHRFYSGHTGIAIAQLFTLGGLGIWSFVDTVMLSFDLYTDCNGKKLKHYNMIAGVLLFVFKAVPALIMGLLAWLYIFIIILAVMVGIATGEIK